MNKEEQGAGELYLRLIEQLKCEPNFVSDDGELKKWVVAEAARAYSADVISLLLKDELLRNAFFVNVNGTEVFKLDRFLLFVEQKNYLNDGYTQFSQKVGLKIGGKFLNQRSEVELVFPHKDCVLEGGQTKEDQKRQEIFFNEVLAQDEITQLLEPKVLTGGKRYDSEGEHPLDGFVRDAEINEKRGLPKDTITDNLIVKGNNLLALHTLKREFAGKVKLIYIDPPYNTGNDSFGYNDSFNHSTWLVFMKNRLEIAKDLLSQNGVLCIQCDDNEQAYLKVLLDGIKGFSFLNNIAVKMSEASGVKMNHARGRFPKLKEYILIYTKPDFNGFITIDKYRQGQWDNENNILLEGLTREDREKLIEIENKETQNIDDVNCANKILHKVRKTPLSEVVNTLSFNSNEEKEEWLFENSYRIIKTAGSTSLANLIRANEDKVPNQEVATFLNRSNNLFYYICDFNRNTRQPRLQVIFSDENLFKNPCDFWQDIKTTGAIANEGGVQMPNGKKPEKILYRLIKMITKEGDIVLDFFLGSGTTAAVAHKMSRQYLGCEQINSQIVLANSRLSNVINGDNTGVSNAVNWRGGGSFVYMELKKYNQEFIEEIESATKTEELLTIWEKMKQKAFFRFNVDMQKFDEGIEEFKALALEQQKECLCKMLDLNQLYVNRSDMEDETAKVTEEEKRITKNFYQEA
jgi:adenine-specific DNA-methyltransferase